MKSLRDKRVELTKQLLAIQSVRRRSISVVEQKRAIEQEDRLLEKIEALKRRRVV